ncbi:MAG: adenylyl-sulfate kinase [Thermoplasmatota archaeon]
MKKKEAFVKIHEHAITRKDREALLGQKGVVLWFTGLSGSGKSTIANEVSYKLHTCGNLSYVLDGDNIRTGLNKDLGFRPDDRDENIRRISEVANLFADVGIITCVACISPYKKMRDFCRELLGRDRFFEIFCKASLKTCEKRDPKGLYQKAQAGLIRDFTGVSAPYEEPENPELIIDTEHQSVDENAELVIKKLKDLKII